MPLLKKGSVNPGSLCWLQLEEGQTQTPEKDVMDTSVEGQLMRMQGLGGQSETSQNGACCQ